MSIGGARTRATLEAKVLTADGGGGYAESWEAYATVWAEISPRGGSEPQSAGRAETRVTHQISLRRRTDVSANHRVRINARLFAIVAVIDPGPKWLWMNLLCEENAP